jgi:uncharacterized protein YutE (UPF0331/DUF86 family)
LIEDVAAQKITSVQRCVARAREALADAGTEFRTNHNLQDAAVLNVIRACDTSIDLANMVIRRRRLGIPSESKDSFAILAREHIVAPELGERLKRMVGFRNLAVHQYRELDMGIVETVIRENLDDVLSFALHIRTQMEAAKSDLPAPSP